MKQTIRFPKERNTEMEKVSRKLQDRFKVKIQLNKNKLVLEGTGIEALKSKNIIEAVLLGFDQKISFKLEDEKNALKTIDIKSYLPKKVSFKHAKGRIIGKKGKTKKLIEMYTGANLSITKKEVSIIGPIKSINIAEKAIIMLIKGKPHSRVYTYLEENQ